MTCARTYGTGKSLTRMGTIELLCSGSAGSYVQRPGCCQDIRLLYYFFLGGGRRRQLLLLLRLPIRLLLILHPFVLVVMLATFMP